MLALLGLASNLTGIGIPQSDWIHKLPDAIGRAAGHRGDALACHVIQLQALMRADGPTDHDVRTADRYCGRG